MSIVRGFTISGKMPEGIEKDEWDRLKQLEAETVLQKQANARERSELEHAEQEVRVLKQHILRQLDIVNQFINDPGAIERIEDYEQIFSSGNLANLKVLAGMRRGAS